MKITIAATIESQLLRLNAYVVIASAWNDTSPVIPLNSVDKRIFRNPGRQQHGTHLVKQCPELQVIDVKRIVRGITHDSGDHLGGFDRHLPLGKAARSDVIADGSADRQCDERPRSRRRLRYVHRRRNRSTTRTRNAIQPSRQRIFLPADRDRAAKRTGRSTIR